MARVKRYTEQRCSSSASSIGAEMPADWRVSPAAPLRADRGWPYGVEGRRSGGDTARMNKAQICRTTSRDQINWGIEAGRLPQASAAIARFNGEGTDLDGFSRTSACAVRNHHGEHLAQGSSQRTAKPRAPPVETRRSQSAAALLSMSGALRRPTLELARLAQAVEAAPSHAALVDAAGGRVVRNGYLPERSRPGSAR